MGRTKSNATSNTGSPPEDTSVKIFTPDSTEKVETVELKTKEQVSRSSPAVIEKAKDAEKDTAPVILVHWTDPAGKRHTKTYTCAEIKVVENKNETMTKSTKKTNLFITLEAQVIETDTR
jgi:hypothetical protein